MDYGMFTPEINSGRMYAGAGSGPLMAAAAAWDALAAELHSAAASYGSVVSGLTTEWSGPSSAAMAAAAAPYVAWMTTTATQAQQAGGQAKAAAGAYEAAFAMTVPPPVVAANRSLLASLMATNVLGQNTPAIAATEAHYGEMWAQDAAAMYGYAGASAAATKVTPFTPPKQITNPVGQAGQTAAVAQATGTSAATNTQSTLSQVTSAVPNALQQFASPAASAPTLAAPTLAAPTLPLGLQPGDVTNALTNLSSSSFSPMGLAGITQVGSDLAVIRSLGGVTGGLSGPAAGAALAPSGAVGALGGIGTSGAVSAGLGQASTVGALSVPSSWASAVPAATPAAAALPGSSFSAIPANGAAGMPGMPMGGMGGMGGRFGGTGPRYGFKPVVMARPPAAGYGPLAI